MSTNLYMDFHRVLMNLLFLLWFLRIVLAAVAESWVLTRLSHPPRIIAFVRLEIWAGVEEVIERLQGWRMLQGWNNTGSRIPIRFADTSDSEQRELRVRAAPSIASCISCLSFRGPGQILVGVCDGSTPLPCNFRFHDSLNSLQAFYVNKYIDYHTHEIAF